MKSNANFKEIIFIEVEIAFESKVKAELYINPEGSIAGTETIVSMNELVKVGYQVSWKKDQLVIKKKEKVQPVEVRSGTPVMPNEVCLKLIDEIEKSERARVRSVKTASTEDDFN